MTSRRRIQLPFVERADGTVTTQDDPHPAYVVWELTLRCDQPCTHCGSRAGDARESELDTEAALDVVRQLAAMRAREVAVIGGEAYLHPGFLAIVRALAHAGLARASVSIDGLEPTHDLMRAARGSFASATRALAHLRAARIQACQVQLTTPLGRGRGWPGHDPPAVRSARPRAADRRR